MIEFRISTTKSPIKVRIYSPNGEILVNSYVVGGFANFCVCCDSLQVAIQAEFNSIRQVRFIRLEDCDCQVYNVNFTFQDNANLQYIYLLDRYYGLPIRDAILNFNGM